ncbi:hypothetical protein THRCLA_21345 [Thraustotheca clavata]|uniref:Uncharacterized protein n=1 Tax=Thraustotheca clavata TaxID=74557 RepID=A0A1V9ZXM7_9STRA|nr:hypothetical protein THRCLA_21345 [Thraustotheca clavata]
MTRQFRYRLCIVDECIRYAKVHGTCLVHARLKGATISVPPLLPSLQTLQNPTRPICVRLKNRNRQCAAIACLAYARRGGYCTRHGGGKKCHIKGCTTKAQAHGICRLHKGQTYGTKQHVDSPRSIADLLSY